MKCVRCNANEIRFFLSVARLYFVRNIGTHRMPYEVPSLFIFNLLSDYFVSELKLKNHLRRGERCEYNEETRERLLRAETDLYMCREPEFCK